MLYLSQVQLASTAWLGKTDSDHTFMWNSIFPIHPFTTMKWDNANNNNGDDEVEVEMQVVMEKSRHANKILYINILRDRK